MANVQMKSNIKWKAKKVFYDVRKILTNKRMLPEVRK